MVGYAVATDGEADAMFSALCVLMDATIRPYVICLCLLVGIDENGMKVMVSVPMVWTFV